MNAAQGWLSLALLAGLGLLWLGVSLGRWWTRLSLAREGRRANQRGALGEREAEELLRQLGYRIRGRHVEGAYSALVDGQPKEIRLFADLLVEREGQELVAEVKTGAQAPRVGHAETRRQLLEYQLAFRVPSVLLVDVDARRVREVCFPVADAQPVDAQRPARAGWSAAAYLVALTALLTWAWFARGR